ncbi:hypothetical protein BCU41_025945 [Vibrio lentus]|uniref:hypothetical protein n=1 Tax=Vibrio lentus TaxID=136468 RepID=UPI0039A4605A
MRWSNSYQKFSGISNNAVDVLKHNMAMNAMRYSINTLDPIRQCDELRVHLEQDAANLDVGDPWHAGQRVYPDVAYDALYPV